MKPAFAVLFALSLLCGCASPGGVPPVGLSVQQTETGRYRVTYRGTSKMSESEVQDRVLLQAAELTLHQGSAWFQVVTRSADAAPPTSPQFSFGIGGASFGRNSGVGVGADTTVGGGASFVATLEITLGSGARPAAPDAYDAQDVELHLSQRLPA